MSGYKMQKCTTLPSGTLHTTRHAQSLPQATAECKVIYTAAIINNISLVYPCIVNPGLEAGPDGSLLEHSSSAAVPMRPLAMRCENLRALFSDSQRH